MYPIPEGKTKMQTLNRFLPLLLLCLLHVTATITPAATNKTGLPDAAVKPGVYYFLFDPLMHDGDSGRAITAAPRGTGGGKLSVPIRFQDIDAPELDQPYGHDAHRIIQRQFEERTATAPLPAVSAGLDAYGTRVLVHADGPEADLAYWAVSTGQAWVWDPSGRVGKLLRSVNPTGAGRRDRLRKLKAAQDNARQKRLGLWAEPGAIEPWLWRKGKRPAAAKK